MKRTDFAAILLFLALAVLFFAPVLFTDKTLVPFDNLYRFPPWSSLAAQYGVAQPHNTLLDDLILENYAWKNFINESVRAGEIPLWNPYVFAGQPFLAAGQNAALYPLGIVFYILPLVKAYAVFAVLHYWLAAVSMYFFVRVLGLRPFAATVSGILYAYSGFMVVSVVFPMVVSAATWLPAILAFAELTLRQLDPLDETQTDPAPPRRSRVPALIFYALAAGVLIGTQFLAGHVEISYYILLVLAFYSAWRILAVNVSLRKRHIEWRGLVRAGAVMVGIVAVGFALAAIQILPLYELVRLNFREGSASYSEVAGWALPTRQVLTFFIPDFFGNPTHHSYYDIYQAAFVPAPQGTIFWGIKNYVEAGAYVGILALVLAVIGVFSSKIEIRRSKFFFITLAVISILFAFGTPLYAILFYGLPGWNQLHTAFRWIFPWTLSVAFLAGAGVQFTSEGLSKRALTLIGGLLAAGGLITLFVVVLSLVMREQFLRFADAFVNASDLAKPVFETGQAFWSYQARNLTLFGIFVLAAGIVLLLARMGWRVRGIPVWKPLAVLVLVADVFIIGMGFYPRADAKLASVVPPAVQFLQQDKSLFRVTSYDVPGEKMMNANSLMPFGIEDIRGYDSIIAKQYADYMRALAPQDELLYNRIAAIYDYQPLSSPLLNLLNVKYVLTSRAVPNPGYELVYDGEIKIYENKNVLPRAFFVNTARVIEDPAQLLAALPTADLTNEVLLETPPAQPLQSAGVPPAPPTMEKYTGSEVILNANLAAPAYLVLTDTYFPGWLAQIDGQDTPIYRANGNFRAVQVPAGEHTIRFKYSPVPFRIGSVLSLMAVIGVLLALVALVWQRFVITAAGGADSQVRTVAKNSLVPMGASLLIQLINLALAFVVLRVLGPENNGRYAFAVTVWFFLSAITEFGLGILTTREVSRDRSRASTFLTNSIFLRLGLTVVSFLLLVGVIAVYSATGDLNQETIWAMVLLWLSLFPNHVAGAFSGMFYAYERFEYPTAIEIATIGALDVFRILSAHDEQSARQSLFPRGRVLALAADQ